MTQESSSHFRTKIGAGLVVFLFVVFVGISTLLCLQGDANALFFLVPFFALIAYFVVAIRYSIDSTHLIIRCPGFYRHTIAVSSIRNIHEIWSILSSPAASGDRLEIAYNKYDSVMISPNDKSGFIAAILAINPHIEVVLKEKK